MSHAPARSAGECIGAAVCGPVVVFDGPYCPVGTWSEAFRHACEARRILRLPTREQRQGWLAAIEKRRGIDARKALEKTMLRLHRARNRAVPSDQVAGVANKALPEA